MVVNGQAAHGAWPAFKFNEAMDDCGKDCPTDSQAGVRRLAARPRGLR
ncbi:MAG TPA: hypothetical protein VGD18_05180 [Thiobacillaceae bacterium]